MFVMCQLTQRNHPHEIKLLHLVRVDLRVKNVSQEDNTIVFSDTFHKESERKGKSLMGYMTHEVLLEHKAGVYKLQVKHF